jgi:hypothetical protein
MSLRRHKKTTGRLIRYVYLALKRGPRWHRKHRAQYSADLRRVGPELKEMRRRGMRVPDIERDLGLYMLLARFLRITCGVGGPTP